MLYGEVYGRVCVGEACGWRRSGDAATTKDNIIERIGPSRQLLHVFHVRDHVCHGEVHVAGVGAAQVSNGVGLIHVRADPLDEVVLVLQVRNAFVGHDDVALLGGRRPDGKHGFA